MTVPYTFGNATTSIPLSNLDADFATPITLGNTNVYLGNTTTNINNLSLGNVSITSVGSTFPNSYLSNSSATLGNAVVTLVTKIVTKAILRGGFSFGAAGPLSAELGR